MGAGPLVADGQFVFWIDGQTNINKVDRLGGQPVTLATAQAVPTSIALDMTHVYWPNSFGGAVVRVPKSGGPVETVVTAVEPLAVAVDDNWVYWVQKQGAPNLFRAPKTGGGNAAPLFGATVGNRSVYVDTVGVWAIGAHPTSPKFGVLRISKDGSGSFTYMADVSLGSLDRPFAMDTTKIAFADDVNGLYICEKATPLACASFGACIVPQSFMAIADPYVYYSNDFSSFYYGGGLRRVTACNAANDFLAGDLPNYIAVDDQFVFYSYGNAIRRHMR